MRDLIFESDAEVLATLRALTDERLQGHIVGAYDLQRRTAGVFAERWRAVLVLACEERDARRALAEEVLDGLMPTVSLGQVTEDGPAGGFRG
jgi:hypothetical protein